MGAWEIHCCVLVGERGEGVLGFTLEEMAQLA